MPVSLIGKTEQAQKDMSRLAEIRKKREADAAARKAREEGELCDTLYRVPD